MVIAKKASKGLDNGRERAKVIGVSVLALFACVYLAFALHPIAAMLGMGIAIVLLVRLPGRLPDTDIGRMVAYSLAIAILVLAIAVPTGEFGMRKCPEAVYAKEGYPTVKYFYSPLCPHCATQDEILEGMIAEGLSFRLEKYDIRYCKDEAAVYGFESTPCMALVSRGGTETRCGVASAQEIRSLAPLSMP